LSRVRTEIKRLAYLSFSQEIDPEHSLNAHYQSVLQEHEDMVQALQQRNANDLNELISVHIRTFQQRIMQSMMS
jgi:DNA-binding FadR family transcriptional regulator